MTKASKHTELPAAADIDKSREREFPAGIVTRWLDMRSWKETDAWEFDLRLTYNNGRRRFATWCIRGFDRNNEKRARYALRQRAARLGVVFIEIYETRRPPTMAEVIEIEKLNNEIQKDPQWQENKRLMQERRRQQEEQEKKTEGASSCVQ